VTEKKKGNQRERKYIIPRACAGVLVVLKTSCSSALRKNDFCHLAYLCVSCDKDNLKRLPPETQLTDCPWKWRRGVFFARHELCHRFFYYTRLGLYTYVSLKVFQHIKFLPHVLLCWNDLSSFFEQRETRKTDWGSIT